MPMDLVKETFKLIFRYLNNRTQRVTTNKTFSSWRALLCGAPHGSVLRKILFNDLFSFLNEIDVPNFAYDITPFVYHKNLIALLEKLERKSELAIHWFEDNYVKLHIGKCHLLISGPKHEHQWAPNRKRCGLGRK